MRRMCLILSVTALLAPVICLATKPCKPLSKSEFLTEVAHQSDLVALVSISEMSPNPNDPWTKALVDEKILDLKNETAKTITINKWQANYEPLFYYKAGDKLILWLRKVGNAYELTNNEWGACEPAIWPVENNVVHPSFNDETNAIHSITAVRKIIAKP